MTKRRFALAFLAAAVVALGLAGRVPATPPPRGLDVSVVTAMAGRLQGHLLLEHGDIDDNVHPAETIRFADALMKANKNFDMLFVPNMFHGESGEHALYLVRRRWDYFVQHLLGVTPPPNFEIKEDRESMGNARRRRR